MASGTKSLFGQPASPVSERSNSAPKSTPPTYDNGTSTTPSTYSALKRLEMDNENIERHGSSKPSPASPNNDASTAPSTSIWKEIEVLTLDDDREVSLTPFKSPLKPLGEGDLRVRRNKENSQVFLNVNCGKPMNNFSVQIEKGTKFVKIGSTVQFDWYSKGRVEILCLRVNHEFVDELHELLVKSV